MSRKMVVGTVAAAGVVGFGSAAAATVGPLELGAVKDKLPVVSNADDHVRQQLGGEQRAAPASPDLQSTLQELRGKLSSEKLNIDQQGTELSGDGLATALEDLADRVRESASQVDGGSEAAARLGTELDRAASQLRATSLQAAADGQVAPQDASGSAHSEGKVSGPNGNAATSGAGSVEAGQALEQLKSTLTRVRELDQSDALGGARDVLDRAGVEAQVQRVASELGGLLS